LNGGEIIAINYDGFIILLIVFMGLVPICRGGQWNWKVVEGNKALNVVFWFGWFSALVAGLLTLFRAL
jgi:hypothetical protein